MLIPIGKIPTLLLILQFNIQHIQFIKAYQIMNRSSTQMIAWFTSAKLQMELNQDKTRLRKTNDIIQKRRQKLSKRQNVAIKEEKNMNKAIAEAESFKVMDDHRISIQEFCQRYETDPKKGLTESEAQKRLQLYGENKLSQRQKRHWILDYLHGMANFFSVLLWIGAILCFIAYGVFPADPSNLYLGIVLIAVIFIGTTVEFVQNRKSQAIMQSFKDFVPPETIVIRQGKQRSLSALKIVKGDLIKIQTGKKIPADIRVIQSNGMKVDNSSLTGETELLSRSAECTRPDNAFQTKNIAFFSTLNKEGSGLGIVMFTGDKTFIGQIAGLAVGAQQQQTPLQIQIDRFVFRLGLFAIIMGIIVFVVGILIGFQIITALTLAIGITVANVPTGLLLQVTIALTLTAKRLAKKKVLAKNLQAVQTLGSTTCICSDKTGTLTQNKMTAAHLWYSGKIVKASNYQKQGKSFQYQYNKDSKQFKILQQAATICSVAIFDKSPPSAQITNIQGNTNLTKEQISKQVNKFKQSWEQKLKTMRYLDMNTLGDASQSALIKFFQPIEDIVQVRNRYPVIKNAQGRDCRLLFDSKNKFAYSINKYKTQGSDLCLFTKGAPEKVWKMCTHVYQNGIRVPKTPEWQKKFQDANQFFGKAGQRVLGFACLHLDSNTFTEQFPYRIDDVQTPNIPLFQQTFAGIVSLNDPPRDTVPFSVTKCQAAGVQVIMVTGDQPVTAAAIARQCNIFKSQLTVNEIMQAKKISFDQAFLLSQAIVIHGDQLTKMSLQDEGKPQAEQGKKIQKWLHKKQIVFARTSPAQKLIIVKACQKLGHIVAVTGDGVNDSPAIKKADLGIAMGITGTDVAKDASDMILLNDDFSSIVMGIQQGRKIFDNLKKAITYVMISQVSEIAPFIGLLIIQYPVPVSTVVLLCIDLGTDLIPAIAYAYEPSQIGIMTRKPRNAQDHLVTMKLMGQGYGWMGWSSFFASLLAFFICMHDFGFVVTDLTFKNGVFLVQHQISDNYNPSSLTFGNSSLDGVTKCSQFQNKRVLIDWLYSPKPWLDLRMSALSCNDSSGTAVFSQLFKIGQCRIQQISPISNAPVCYTTEAGKYGQSAYFYANVISQIFNFFLCKTRKQSIFTQGMDNPIGYFGITTECMIMFGLAFVQPLNVVFGTRDCIFLHFGIIAIPFGLLRLILDQIRKYLMRVLPDGDFGKPNYMIRVTLW